jgi:hypothetical protein
LFNNREIATAVWLTLFAIWILTKSNARTSIAGVFRAVLKWKILTCIAAMLLYTSAIVAALYAVGFWQLPMIKETVLWFGFTAFVMVMRFLTSRENDNIMREVLADNLKLIIFLEFLVGTYVMSLAAELVFVPFVTFIVLLDTVAKFDEKYAVVAKFTTFLLAVIGFAILGFAVSRAIGDLQNLGTMDTVRTIAFPPLMSIAFIPFTYVLLVVVTYESIFLRLAIGRDKAPDVVRYAKRRIFFHCGLSLRRLRAFAERPPFEIMQVESNADVDRLFASPERVNAG